MVVLPSLRDRGVAISSRWANLGDAVQQVAE